MGVDTAQTVPIRFQGNPVKIQDRSHSIASQAPARAATRASACPPTDQTAKVARLGKMASPAARPATASGMTAPKRAASTRKAMPTQ